MCCHGCTFQCFSSLAYCFKLGKMFLKAQAKPQHQECRKLHLSIQERMAEGIGARSFQYSLPGQRPQPGDFPVFSSNLEGKLSLISGSQGVVVNFKEINCLSSQHFGFHQVLPGQPTSLRARTYSWLRISNSSKANVLIISKSPNLAGPLHWGKAEPCVTVWSIQPHPFT